MTDQMIFFTGLFILLFAVCFGVVSVFAVRLARVKTELRFLELYGEEPESGRRTFAPKGRRSAKGTGSEEPESGRRTFAPKGRRSAKGTGSEEPESGRRDFTAGNHRPADGTLPREAGARQAELAPANRRPAEDTDGETPQTSRIDPYK